LEGCKRRIVKKKIAKCKNIENQGLILIHKEAGKSEDCHLFTWKKSRNEGKGIRTNEEQKLRYNIKKKVTARGDMWAT
jgi:hypothetical protein